jgi:TetR/AcrR family transcriptional regulator, transcriptional repressor for nem operon
MMTIMQKHTDRKAQTHERIVEVASRAIRRGGYGGVGVADIMKEAGLTHGGFYAHFPSRDAMLVEAMDRAGRDSGEGFADRVAQRRADGESAFAALVNTYLHEAHLGATERGCVIAALVSEMPRQHDAVLDAARRRVQAFIEMVRDALPEGSDPEVAALAAASLIGTLQLARTLGGKSGRTLLAGARQALIEQYAPARRR